MQNLRLFTIAIVILLEGWAGERILTAAGEGAILAALPEEEGALAALTVATVRAATNRAEAMSDLENNMVDLLALEGEEE